MSKKKPNGYWEDWKNIESHLKKLIEAIGHFPTSNELRENECDGLIAGAYKIFGGLRNLRERMGYAPLAKPIRYWKDWENFEKELQKAIKIAGHFPTHKEIKRMNLGSLSMAVGYHGGVEAVRSRLGFTDSSHRPHGYWKNLELALKEAEAIMREYNLEYFPGEYKLDKMGYSSLGTAIHKHHGGFTLFRQKLNEYLGREPDSQQLEGLLERYASGGENE